jgi:hypothetical protein
MPRALVRHPIGRIGGHLALMQCCFPWPAQAFVVGAEHSVSLQMLLLL